MSKTDPRPYDFIFVPGAPAFTLTVRFNGLKVISIEGGSVTRNGAALAVNAILATGDVIASASPAATVTLACQRASEEFSGSYTDLSNAPAGGGGASQAETFSTQMGLVSNGSLNAAATLSAVGVEFTAKVAGSATHVRALLSTPEGLRQIQVLVFVNQVFKAAVSVSVSPTLTDIVLPLGTTVTWAANAVIAIATRGNGSSAGAVIQFATTQINSGDFTASAGPGIDRSVPLKRVTGAYPTNPGYAYTAVSSGDVNDSASWEQVVCGLGNRTAPVGMLAADVFPITEGAPVVGVSVVAPTTDSPYLAFVDVRRPGTIHKLPFDPASVSGPAGPAGPTGPTGPTGPAGSGGTGSVSSVNGRTGSVVLTAGDVGAGSADALQAHQNNTANPHGVSKAQVGLGNVTNDLQVKASEKGAVSGVATLDANGVLSPAQRPVGSALATDPSMIAIGDSITYGDQAGGPGSAWPGLLAAPHNWTVDNRGINGSTLSSSGSNPMVNRYQAAVPAGYNGHVFLLGGTNDWSTGVALGSPGSSNQTTVYGALNALVSGIMARLGASGVLTLLTPTWRADEATRKGAGPAYTLEQVRQAVRDEAARGALAYPGRVRAFELGRELTPWFSDTSGTYINADNLHPTAVGHQLIAGYLLAREGGSDGTTPVHLYSRLFSTLTAGTLNAQDGWTVYGGTATVSATGLSVAQPFATQPRGSLHALPAGASRFAMRFNVGTPGTSEGTVLRAQHRLSDDRSLCVWWLKNNAGTFVDAGVITGSAVVSWIGTNGPTMPADDCWLEWARVSGQIEIRVWAAGSNRPTVATYTHADDAMVADAFGLATIGTAARAVLAVQVD